MHSNRKMPGSPKNICVVILGDIGRSPRMQYHSLSLAEHGHKVDLVGYGETQPLDSLKKEPLLSYHYLNPYPSFPCPRLLNYVIKTIWQTVTLAFVLSIIRKADVILVQNPPAIPSLIVCWIYAAIVRAKLIIDWHNYAYTRMAITQGSKNILVRITEKVEQFAGRKAHTNLCVTKAMKDNLKKTWNVNSLTLYDRPPEIFRSISLAEKHELLSCLGMKYKELLSNEKDSDTAFTCIDDMGNITENPYRPGLLISSTSWSDDEDFSILFSALEEYQNHINSGNHKGLPKLICIVTGKGPLKEHYCNKIYQSKWSHIIVITPWLESKDYPVLLACADLGVCLHTSSSGLDLPMKIIDMFGCGLPVCAYDFNCLHELVKNGINSYTFKDSEQLSHQIQDWFDHFPNNKKQHAIRENFQAELKSFQSLRWRENWNNIVLPLID